MRVSIIVPVYNGVATIRRCVDSLISQIMEKESMEIILVNDSSTDDTLNILKEYENRYPKLVYVLETNENLRQGGARNLGIRYATGDYIGFVDADDWCEPTMYAHMLEKAYAFDCDVVCCRLSRDDHYYLHDSDAIISGTDMGFVVENDSQRSDFIASHIIGNQVTLHIYRKDFLLKNRISFPEKMVYEDNLFEELVYLYANRLYILEERLYHYFVNESSTILTANADYHDDFFKVGELCWDVFKTSGALLRWKDACEFDHLVQYYLQGIKMISLRYDNPSPDRFRRLQNDICKRIANPMQNPYIESNTTEFQRMQLEFLNYNLNDAEIVSFLKSTRKMYMVLGK